MATVKKKVRRAQWGETLRECKIDSQGRTSCGPGQSTKDPTAVFGRPKGLTKKEERELIQFEKEQRINAAVKKAVPISTAPGVRSDEVSGEYKKGSQSFFGGNTSVNEAKYGKKMTKIKKAQRGKKVADSVESEMFPGTKIPRSKSNYESGFNIATGKPSAPKKSAPKRKMKSGGSFPDLNKDGKITRADILKGRGVIAKKGASVKKAKMGCMSCGGKMKKK